MTAEQRSALLSLAAVGSQDEEPEALRGTGWAARYEDWEGAAFRWRSLSAGWRLTPAGRGAVEALRAGAGADEEPKQMPLALSGQRRLF